jgi:DNA (cytosine-5)-methyltransferase 1
VLGEVRPTWALFENPPGIGDVGLARILVEMEGLGYEVRVFGIPACAVGAPHRRERYWIVAHAETRQDDSGEMGHLGEEENCREGSDSAGGMGNPLADANYLRPDPTCSSQGDLADTAQGRYTRAKPECNNPENTERRRCHAIESISPWDNFVWVPCADGKFRRAPDNSIGLVDGLHRSLLAALGNSIVPQVAERIIRAMIEADR